jgi:hypothetical protein
MKNMEEFSKKRYEFLKEVKEKLPNSDFMFALRVWEEIFSYNFDRGVDGLIGEIPDSTGRKIYATYCYCIRTLVELNFPSFPATIENTNFLHQSLKQWETDYNDSNYDNLRLINFEELVIWEAEKASKMESTSNYRLGDADIDTAILFQISELLGYKSFWICYNAAMQKGKAFYWRSEDDCFDGLIMGKKTDEDG